jgi:hypothetical protein
MSDSPKADRAMAIMAAAGHDLNNHLMVAGGELAEALARLPADNPLRPYLLGSRTAIERCCSIAALLVACAARAGAEKPQASLEYLVGRETP